MHQLLFLQILCQSLMHVLVHTNQSLHILLVEAGEHIVGDIEALHRQNMEKLSAYSTPIQP